MAHTHSPSRPGPAHQLLPYEDGDLYLLCSGSTRRLLPREVRAAAAARLGLRLVAAQG